MLALLQWNHAISDYVPCSMRVLILAASVFCACPSLAQPKHLLINDHQMQAALPSNKPQVASTPTRPPLQVELRVPFQPTAFPSSGQMYLMYELHLTNFETVPLELHRVEVLDADADAVPPIATFGAGQLYAMVQSVGADRSVVGNGKGPIPAGGTTVVFISIALGQNSHVPLRLLHRVLIGDSAVEGAVIGTHHTALHVLGAPVEGSNWLASDGPSNDPENHHRRGIFVLAGRVTISRRYAIDWKQTEGGAAYSGDARDVRSYYAYGKSVFSVADGRVVMARDGLPDNVPGHGESFHPAVPITMETIAGNTITLDLGGGQYAYYMHLQPGSLRVKAGDRIRRGQLLAHVGCSGDAREPHLHFEVTSSPKLLAGEGVPYVIDRYRLDSASGGSTELHIRELPLRNSVVVFGETRRK